MLERPPADPRARALVDRFADAQGGLSQLVARAAEVIPQCVGSCGDCLGDARPSLSQGDVAFADRTLLQGRAR